MPDMLAPLATLFAAVLGGFILLYAHHQNRHRTAASKFRATLLEALTGLYPIPTDWPKNIDVNLRQVFPILQRAVAEFRPYVPWHKRRSYDRAWFVYRLGPDGREIDKQLYHQYMGFTSPEKPVKDPQETFRSNVAGLLSFADKI